MPITLQSFMQDANLRQQLSMLCDVGILVAPEPASWVTIDGADSLTVIARDGGGGQFATAAPRSQIIYVTSEGAAGVLADNLDDLLLVVVSCPYWQDLLHFSGGGDLAEMRRAQPALEQAWLDDDEDNADTREQLFEALDLAPGRDPVALLHQAVQASRVTVRTGGEVAASLFNRFTIDDNPMLAQA